MSDSPSEQATDAVSAAEAAEPAVEPGAEPAVEPDAEPAVEPDAEPAVEPGAEPAVESDADGVADEEMASDAPNAVARTGGPTLLRPLQAEGGTDDGVCSVELEQFEGPLDLLLHLVRRHELDILDIPISFVCAKYLEYIDVMRALDLEVAGDYLVMAATLAFLKSRELVPSEPTEEGPEAEVDGGPDPREELLARLLQYQKYRAAADELDRLPVQGRDTFPRGQSIDLPPMDAGLAPITLYRLAEAFHRVLDRARILKSHDVVLETISVAGRMEQLTVILIERRRVDFETLFLERDWPSEQELRSVLVVTLMSILELVRMGVARVYQEEGAVRLEIELAATEQDAREALATYDESLSFGTGTAPVDKTAPQMSLQGGPEKLPDRASAQSELEPDIVGEGDEPPQTPEHPPQADAASPVEAPNTAEDGPVAATPTKPAEVVSSGGPTVYEGQPDAVTGPSGSDAGLDPEPKPADDERDE